MKNIAVFFGGNSIEHDISIITGVLTLNSIDKEKYNPIPIFVSREGVFYTGDALFDPDGYKNLNYKKLSKVTLIAGDNTLYAVKGKRLKRLANIYCAINCMHGERGEDGSLSALLSLSKIANASPEMLSSSVCMSKSFTKIVLKGLNVPCLPSITVRDNICSISIEDFGYPVIVKPNTGGSSIGISKANDSEELDYAIINALSFSRTAIIEPALTNFTEINCACFSDKDGNLVVSECEKPIGRDEVLTFKDKYEEGKRQFPADIEKSISHRIKKMTARIYKELELKGVVRIDYFIKDEKIYVNEINTVPGSLAYYLFCKTTKEFKSMLNEIIDFALLCFNKGNLLKTKYESGILCTLKAKGSKNVK